MQCPQMWVACQWKHITFFEALFGFLVTIAIFFSTRFYCGLKKKHVKSFFAKRKVSDPGENRKYATCAVFSYPKIRIWIFRNKKQQLEN